MEQDVISTEEQVKRRFSKYIRQREVAIIAEQGTVRYPEEGADERFFQGRFFNAKEKADGEPTCRPAA